MGRRYRFETRARPVIRTTRNDPDGPGREIDIFAATAKKDGPEPDREAVYAAWLVRAIDRTGGARVLPGALAIKAMKRTRLYTGDNHRPGGMARVEGPDVIATGVLEVCDPLRFAALVARGLGRHRAFGFGMLLLAPGG
jgi:CRISPR system Cascade subunit CasE